MDLFDTRNVAETRNDLFPGERLVVCHDPLLAEDRKRTLEGLLAVTDFLLRHRGRGRAPYEDTARPEGRRAQGGQ
jgi:hypothetical protein